MHTGLSIKNCLESQVSELSSADIKLEMRLLLEHTLNVNHAWLISHADDEISSEQHQQFQTLLQRRIAGEPIAYILGEREFYGLSLKVTPDTLIPRPDTETLVEAVLVKLSNQPSTILDLGTGTGAIALAVAKHSPQSQVTAVDYSASALAVAKENSANLSINNVELLQSDWFVALSNLSFDIIVSNPPYIEDNDSHLNQGDLRFEPRTALASGADGLDAIRHITQKAPAHLNANGWLMFEHGYNQAQAVATLLESAGFSAIETIKDLGGNDRVTIGQLI